MDNTTFSNNTATNHGGAIYTSGITGINGATFQNNYAPNDGGAIVNSTNPININGAILFDNNDSGGSKNVVSTLAVTIPADTNRDLKVDFADFALMAQSWLTGGH